MQQTSFLIHHRQTPRYRCFDFVFARLILLFVSLSKSCKMISRIDSMIFVSRNRCIGQKIDKQQLSPKKMAVVTVFC